MQRRLEEAIAQPLMTALSAVVVATLTAIGGALTPGALRIAGLTIAGVLVATILVLLIVVALRAAGGRAEVGAADAQDARLRGRGDRAFLGEIRESFVERAWPEGARPLRGDKVAEAMLQRVAERFFEAFGLKIGIVIVADDAKELTVEVIAGHVNTRLQVGHSCPHDRDFTSIMKRFAEHPWEVPLSFPPHKYRFVLLCDERALREEELNLADEAALWYQMMVIRAKSPTPPSRPFSWRSGSGRRREGDA